MSEKTSRKNFLFTAGTVVAGCLAYCGIRRGERVAEALPAGGKTAAVTPRPEPRAVPLRRA